MTPERGKFITIEGTEGVGKTTNVAFICQWLEQNNIDFVATREPGGTPFAESIRELLLSNRDEEVDENELMENYMASQQERISIVEAMEEVKTGIE